MKNLFVVSTPHHLLSVYIAKNHFDMQDGDCDLIVCYQDNEKGLFEKLLNNTTWKRIIWIQGWDKKKQSAIERIKRIISFKNAVKRANITKSEYDRFFIIQYTTDYTYYLINTIKYDKLFLLDEGNASYRWAVVRRNQQHGNKPGIIKQILFNFKLRPPTSLTFFSNYMIDVALPDEFIKCRKFDHVKESEKYSLTDEVVLLGSSEAEHEMNILDESYYLSICNEIYNRYKTSNIVYIPHRKEDPGKIRLIEKMGFRIVKHELPIEFAFFQSKGLPYKVISFASAALLNIHLYFPMIKVESYVYDMMEIHNNKEILTDIYNYYRSIQDPTFEVIEI